MWNNFLNLKESKKSGFTLIEMMVAISIFSIVALIATSALITASRVNQRAQALKIATDNLQFALSSMAFKLRQGGNYRCITGDVSSLNPAMEPSAAKDCRVICGSGGGKAIVFSTPKWGESKKVAYRWNEVSKGLEYWTEKEDGSNTGFLPITTANLEINNLRFYVDHAVDDLGSPGSPRVFLTMVGTAKSAHDQAQFQLQTLISERI